ncbi:MAG: tetratricopeptide repeat protein [Acidobacteria bacterium]|nr:tetratricopeptide repeat protein [Acidobacteriota bacterium]MDW7983628.1 tetratricopeptide repeat protein [Acidobacteriota bacterium]
MLWTIVGLAGSIGCRRFWNELRARQLIREAKEFYQKEDYADACPRYEQALQLTPDNLNLRRSLAYCYMAWYKPLDPAPENQALVDKAAQLFKEIMALQPENRQIQEDLMTLYLNANRYTDAIDLLQQRLQSDPDDPDLLKNVASLYVKANQYDAAFDWYEKWGAVQRDTAEPWYIIGSLAWQKVYCAPARCLDPTLSNEARGEYIRRGIEALQKAIQIDPEHAEAYAYLNLLYREKAKWVDAGDPAKQQEDLQLADRYRDKAQQLVEARKKRKAEGPTASSPQ